MPDTESSSDSSDSMQVAAATTLGCERILAAAFSKLWDQLRSIRTELSLREPPHAAGILEVANSLRDRRQAIRVHIMMKKNYMELCGISANATGSFAELVELYQRSARLEQDLRAASNASEEAAQDAIRDAQDEIEDFISTTRKQVAAVHATIRTAVASLCVQAEALPVCEPTIFEGTRDQPFAAVSVDMKGYGDISRQLEDMSWEDSTAVLEFNRAIRDEMTEALNSVRVAPDTVWRDGTGDGEILIFKNPETAVRFARAFRTRMVDRNIRNRNRDSGTDKCFRTGIATGRVSIRETRDLHERLINLEMGGTIIAEAVRIQSACAPEEIMMCEETFMAIPIPLRAEFPHHRLVRGKPHENLRIKAHSTHFGSGYLMRVLRAIGDR